MLFRRMKFSKLHLVCVYDGEWEMIEGAPTVRVRELDKKSYVAVNEIIEMFGGCWSRKHQVHVFEGYNDVDSIRLLIGDVLNGVDVILEWTVEVGI